MSTTDPPHGDDWPAVAQPIAGCTVCDRLADRRTAARERDDGTRVTDANVLLRRHHKQVHDS